MFLWHHDRVPMRPGAAIDTKCSLNVEMNYDGAGVDNGEGKTQAPQRRRYRTLQVLTSFE